jgi:tol-pal system protein YbgF
MFRHPLLPCARLLVVAFGLAGVAAPAPAWSQDRSTQERIERLERDLNMLQRQVYRGAPPPPVIGGDGGAAVNAEIRMDRLEAQMRELTGRVEEFTNQIEQVRQRADQLASDVETRFNQAATGAGPPTAANPAQSRPGSARPARQFAAPPPIADDEDLSATRPVPGAESGPPIRTGTAVPAPDGSTPIFGTLTPPGAPASPAPLASAAPSGHPNADGALPGGSAIEQYNHALGLLKEANYPAAEAALKDFISQHPKDPMAGNAQYFIGDIHYERREYAEATSAFAEGYKRYPKGAKAADNLLKLGMSLARTNQKDNACLAFRQLDHDFLNPARSIKDRATAEKKRLGC